MTDFKSKSDFCFEFCLLVRVGLIAAYIAIVESPVVQHHGVSVVYHVGTAMLVDDAIVHHRLDLVLP